MVQPGNGNGVTADTFPCEWPISYAECDTLGPEECWSTSQRAIWEELAATYLWNWTGRVFGLCPVDVRPCRSSCSAPGPWGPALIGGQWYNLACGSCSLSYGADACGCPGTIEGIRLPGPMHSVTEVLLNGVVLNPSLYTLTSAWNLVRTDGLRWPVCQDLTLPVVGPGSEGGTWQVTYKRGVPVPLGGQFAAGLLAVELAKAACGDTTCQLPRRVQSITRQGVTVALLDSFDDVEKGRTGVWLIDSWVASVTHRPQVGRVRSPDIPAPRHLTRITPPAPPPLP